MGITSIKYKRDTVLTVAIPEGDPIYYIVNGAKPQSESLYATDIISGERHVLLPELYKPFWVQIGDHIRVGDTRYHVKSMIRRNMEKGPFVVAYLKQVHPITNDKYEKYVPLQILKPADFTLVTREGLEL